MPYKGTIPRICERCATVFWVRPSVPKFGGGKFCGNDCRNESVRIERARTAEVRFMVEVRQEAYDWLWTGSLYPHGYGQTYAPLSKRRYAHIAAWEFATGRVVPEGLQVNHVCDVRNCVRNDDRGIYYVNGVFRPRFGHLWLGTQAENLADMDAKGRRVPRAIVPKPEPAYHRKPALPDAVVAGILERLATGARQADIAVRFGTSQPTVSRIALGLRRVHSQAS